MPGSYVRPQSLFLLVLWLLGTAALAADTSDAGTPPPARAECGPELGEVQRAVAEGRLDEALVLARKSADGCPGARLLAARLLAHQTQFDEASTFLEHELLSPSPSPGAFEQLVGLFPRLSPARQEQVAALGSSREAPLHVRGVAQANLPRFGIHSMQALREALEKPLSADRGSVWLLSWLKDYPSQLPLLTQMVRESPDDLDAVVNLSNIQTLFGDLKGALQTLDAVSLDTVTLKDSRGNVMGTSALFSIAVTTTWTSSFRSGPRRASHGRSRSSRGPLPPSGSSTRPSRIRRPRSVPRWPCCTRNGIPRSSTSWPSGSSVRINRPWHCAGWTSPFAATLANPVHASC